MSFTAPAAYDRFMGRYSTLLAPQLADLAGGERRTAELRLDGAPGVHSARFSGPDATDASNNELLLEQLKGVPTDKRGARFVCVIALVRDGELLSTFHGKVEGRILEAPAGAGGFGYDPLFLFTEEYHTPLLPPVAAAVAGTFGELFFPVLLVLGVFTRIGAVGLFAVNAMALISYWHVLGGDDFAAARGQHYLWGYMALVIATCGAGSFSLDAWLERRKPHGYRTA